MIQEIIDITKKYEGVRPTKGMFVACDEDDNVLVKPHPESDMYEKVDEFQEAEKRIIFSGFEVAENGDIWNPELKKWAFIAGEVEGYYKSIFLSVDTVIKVGIPVII